MKAKIFYKNKTTREYFFDYIEGTLDRDELLMVLHCGQSFLRLYREDVDKVEIC